MIDIGAAVDPRAVPNLDAVAMVRELEGPAGRVIDATVWRGMRVRIMVDRGMDILHAWFRGVPLAWISAVGEQPALGELTGFRWNEAFGGGLVATCGLRNVGWPSEGHGLHGTYSHLPAVDVDVDISQSGCRLSGTVIDDGPQPLQHERRIVVAGDGSLTLEDVTTNLGNEPTEAPILYHCNFGYPLWAGAARLDVNSTRLLPRDDASEPSVDTWRRPLPVTEGPERVLEHLVDASSGVGVATISNLDVGVELTVTWSLEQLPRLHQWLDPNPGMAVLGIEPANASVAGRAHDRSEGRLPMLAAGASRATGLHITASAI